MQCVCTICSIDTLLANSSIRVSLWVTSCRLAVRMANSTMLNLLQLIASSMTSIHITQTPLAIGANRHLDDAAARALDVSWWLGASYNTAPEPVLVDNSLLNLLNRNTPA